MEWDILRNAGSAGSLGPASGDSLRVADEPEEAVTPHGYEALER